MVDKKHQLGPPLTEARYATLSPRQRLQQGCDGSRVDLLKVTSPHF